MFVCVQCIARTHGYMGAVGCETITLRNYLSIASEILLSLDTCTCLVY